MGGGGGGIPVKLPFGIVAYNRESNNSRIRKINQEGGREDKKSTLGADIKGHFI